jgi:hypothetical protein
MFNTYIVNDGVIEVDAWFTKEQFNKWFALYGRFVSFACELLVIDNCAAVSIIKGSEDDIHYQMAKDYIQENIL